MKRILIALPIFILFTIGCKPTEGEIIVLPSGFKGYIVIIFNQVTGSPSVYNDGKRVYKIPLNGILKSQFSENNNWVGLTSFYYKTITAESKLPSFIEFDKIPQSTTVGFIGSSGNANKDLAGKQRVAFTFFYVGTKSEIAGYRTEANKLDIANL